MTWRVFVVDDDRDHAESIADLLALYGYEVEVAYSGEQAIKRFAEADFDVTLMDVRLPGMNGVETFFRFREARPGSRIIMMTGLSVERLVAEAIEGGALGILYKPFSADELVKALKRAEAHGLVLVADDDPSAAEHVCHILSDAGYRTDIARCGSEALEKLAARNVDCLILDLRLPPLSGVQVIRSLQTANCGVPTIIIIEGEQDKDDVERQLGCREILVKPIDPALLVDTVRRAVGEDKNAHAA